MIMFNAFNNLSEKESQTEASQFSKKGFTLPEDYLYFITLTNGGFFTEEINLIITFNSRYGIQEDNISCDYFYQLIKTERYKETVAQATERLHQEIEFMLESGEIITTTSIHIDLIPFYQGLGNTAVAFHKNTHKVYAWSSDEDLSGYLLSDYPIIANSFTSFLKLLIDQNNGYIKGLSEIYSQLKQKGFD